MKKRQNSYIKSESEDLQITFSLKYGGFLLFRHRLFIYLLRTIVRIHGAFYLNIMFLYIPTRLSLFWSNYRFITTQ